MENKKLEKIDDRVGSPAMNGDPGETQTPPEEKKKQKTEDFNMDAYLGSDSDNGKTWTWILIFVSFILLVFCVLTYGSGWSLFLLAIAVASLLSAWYFSKKYNVK